MGWPKSQDEVMTRLTASPFTVYMAVITIFPFIAAFANLIGYTVPSALVELNSQVYILIWGVLGLLASIAIWSGVLKDDSRPTTMGLRLASLVWLSYAILIVDDVVALRGIMFVACITVSSILAILHSCHLAKRARSLKKALRQMSKE